MNLPPGVSGNVYADDPVPDLPTHATVIEPIYSKGTSKRIYGELFKVIDSSDVIVHVLDARDPVGTRCDSVIDYLKKEKSHKQIIFVLNKCDLIPTWATVSSLTRFFCSSVSLLFCFICHSMYQVKPLCPSLRDLPGMRDCYGRGRLICFFLLFLLVRYVCFGTQERNWWTSW